MEATQIAADLLGGIHQLLHQRVDHLVEMSDRRKGLPSGDVIAADQNTASIGLNGQFVGISKLRDLESGVYSDSVSSSKVIMTGAVLLRPMSRPIATVTPGWGVSSVWGI